VGVNYSMLSIAVSPDNLMVTWCQRIKKSCDFFESRKLLAVGGIMGRGGNDISAVMRVSGLGGSYRDALSDICGIGYEVCA
jgi:hypothetical protein